MTETPSRTRFTRPAFARGVTLVGAAAAMAFASACSSDSVTSPSASTQDPAAAALAARKLEISSWMLDGLQALYAKGLTRDDAVDKPVVKSALISSKGGKIEIKDLGFELTIPKDALPGGSMVITVTALPGKVVAYDFQPHGTVFLKPLVVRQDLDDTSWDHWGFKGSLKAGYFDEEQQSNLRTLSKALLNEEFSLSVSSKRAEFNIFHFSGYMVSTGRTQDPGEI